ncbi:hypothetical protein Bca52824_080261 [Brassica carinata]|uniref:Uncharacterized protein n=1 Tax=Brassica carinata TaxID=52824 RepID=A0A8X7TPW5_BRACI|nr:hypothetical protein Bca52824_080261 [Brassica carinata]
MIHGSLLLHSTREAEVQEVLSWKTHYNQAHPSFGSDDCCPVGSTAGREHLPISSVSKGATSNMVQPIRERISMDQQYDVLEPQQGYPTFTHFPAEDQEMWFRQFAADENVGEPVDDFVLMKTAHTNKHTGEIDDGVVRDVLSLIETQKEDEETVYLSFKPTWAPLATDQLVRIESTKSLNRQMKMLASG